MLVGCASVTDLELVISKRVVLRIEKTAVKWSKGRDL